jgi:hydrogenase maturation factor
MAQDQKWPWAISVFRPIATLPQQTVVGIVSSKEERHGKIKARFKQAVRNEENDAACQKAR